MHSWLNRDGVAGKTQCLEVVLVIAVTAITPSGSEGLSAPRWAYQQPGRGQVFSIPLPSYLRLLQLSFFPHYPGDPYRGGMSDMKDCGVRRDPVHAFCLHATPCLSLYSLGGVTERRVPGDNRPGWNVSPALYYFLRIRTEILYSNNYGKKECTL